MTKFQYFKVTFFSVGLGLTVGLLLWNLWDLGIYDIAHIRQAIFKSLFVGVLTAFILALINAFFKLFPFKQVQPDDSLNR